MHACERIIIRRQMDYYQTQDMYLSCRAMYMKNSLYSRYSENL